MISNVDDIKVFGDKRGYLIPIEFSSIDFDPKRVFLVNNVPVNGIRGGHAHYKTKQYLVCTSGKVEVHLDDGNHKQVEMLSKDQGIMIPEMVWDHQRFITPDSSIMVLCSTEYDLSDYILDYNKFIKHG
jgi:dTDP-4-dehydrorhamnose 3,5-epimerase-like enzyme